MMRSTRRCLTASVSSAAFWNSLNVRRISLWSSRSMTMASVLMALSLLDRRMLVAYPGGEVVIRGASGAAAPPVEQLGVDRDRLVDARQRAPLVGDVALLGLAGPEDDGRRG